MATGAAVLGAAGGTGVTGGLCLRRRAAHAEGLGPSSMLFSMCGVVTHLCAAVVRAPGDTRVGVFWKPYHHRGEGV